MKSSKKVTLQAFAEDHARVERCLYRSFTKFNRELEALIEQYVRRSGYPESVFREWITNKTIADLEPLWQRKDEQAEGSELWERGNG